MFRGIILRKFRHIRLESLLPSPVLVNTNWTQISCLSTSLYVRSKIFHDNENHHAHEVLVNSLRDYKFFQPITVNNAKLNFIPVSILDPPDSSACVPDQVFEDFKSLMLYCRDNSCCVSEDRFDNFVDLFCEVCHQFSDQQLIDCLSHLRLHPSTKSTRTKNFCEIWNALDWTCLKRIDHWSIKENLHIADAWYQMGLARISDFVRNALRKMGRRVTKMTHEEMLHSMFFCNIVRRPLIDMFEYELSFNRLIDEITINEIGVMSMGFFKTQTPIRNPQLIDEIFRRLIDSVDTVEDITLVAILKVLRYSSKLSHVDLIDEILDKLVPQIGRLSLLSCLHVALLGSDIQTCHDESIELILKRFLTDIDSTRLKDMERICHVISLYNYESPNGLDKELCGKILTRLKEKIPESVLYPRCFSNCLHFLTLRGFYDEDMISAILDPKFIRHSYETNIVKAREIFCLDSYVKINLKDSYQGNQLSDKYRRTMGRLLTHYIPERNSKFKTSTTDRILLEMKESADALLRITTFKHILPHFERPDVVVCYDTVTKKAIPLSPDCPEDYIGAILTRKHMLGELSDNPNIITVAIVVAGWNNAVRGKHKPTGSFQMKLNQLEILGHRHCMVYWHEWRQLETLRDRHDFLNRKLAAICS